MPLYQYECMKCHKLFDEIRQVENRLSAQCVECGSNCRILIGRVSVRTFEPYYDTQLGTRITSPKHKKQVAKALGVTNIEGAKFHEIDHKAEENKRNREEAYMNEPPSQEFMESWAKAKAQHP